MSSPSPAAPVWCIFLVALALVPGCGGSDTASNVEAPGAPKAAGTTLLEAGAAALQDRPPIEALNAYLDGFHFYSGRLEEQMEAHHYCSIVNEEVTQCVIYDGNAKDAKIMGIEYIVSERLFRSLPPAEKAFWHSHAHEVKSGQLVAPGIPEAAEHALMRKLVGTYGKTWHTWHTDQDKTLPIGVPQLMMGFTADGQAHEALVAARDARLGVRSADKRSAREDIETPEIVEGADVWQHGAVIQLQDPRSSGNHHTGSRTGNAPTR